MAFDPTNICLDDLALAVKPGRSLEAMLDTLATLGAAHREDGNEDSRRSGSSSSKRPLKGKSKTPSVDIVQPEGDSSALSKSTNIRTGNSVDGSDTSSMTRAVPSLRVETLAGYGEARGWALDLKDDLALWREGVIGWDEMSTKMLLSGPPGTGKTTFAKALCNSLQVPMIVSSVGWWLEPGYLGDVLQRMSATFEAARENAPCLVFIDEVDAIGSRGGGQRSRHDDYWTTIITRLLELLDGALKTQGVIVVAATNLPERIDAALLRSGRLEKHVAIPSPDADALAGILAHHLGSDLAAVLASAPAPKKTLASNPPLEPAAPQSDSSKPSHVNADVRKGQAHV
jgi:cell division protease FtsH